MPIIRFVHAAQFIGGSMKKQSIPSHNALCGRIAKMPWPVRDKMAVLGLQRLYEMGEAAGYRDLNSYVRRRLERLEPNDQR